MIQRHGASFGLDPFGLRPLFYCDYAYTVIAMLCIIDHVTLNCVETDRDVLFVAEPIRFIVIRLKCMFIID